MSNTVVFIKEVKDEQARQRMEAELAETRVSYHFDLNNGAIVVHGDHDMASIVRKVVEELGYEVL